MNDALEMCKYFNAHRFMAHLLWLNSFGIQKSIQQTKAILCENTRRCLMDFVPQYVIECIDVQLMTQDILFLRFDQLVISYHNWH